MFYVFHNVLQVSHDVYEYITMFHNVLRCLVSRATIGIGSRTISNHRRDRQKRSESDPMLNSILETGVTLFLEDNSKGMLSDASNTEWYL